MTCTVDTKSFDDFVSGASDDLVEHVATCDVCQGRLERQLSGAGSDVTESTMRAVRIDSAIKEIAATIVDVGDRYGRALAAYLTRRDR